MKNITTNTTILHNYITSVEESPSSLLHRLHTNERQLRTLAVVLSLTGGLALSFALGVGIMIYWYCHKCKQKRKFNEEDGIFHSEDDESDIDDDEKSCGTNYSTCSCNYNNNVVSHHETTTTTISSSNNNSEITTTNNAAATTISNTSSIHDIQLLPLPPVSTIAVPEPSAPSAKELHFHHHSSNNNNNNSSSHEVEEEGLCHDCSIPPPAYTED